MSFECRGLLIGWHSPWLLMSIWMKSHLRPYLLVQGPFLIPLPLLQKVSEMCDGLMVLSLKCPPPRPVASMTSHFSFSLFLSHAKAISLPVSFPFLTPNYAYCPKFYFADSSHLQISSVHIIHDQNAIMLNFYFQSKFSFPTTSCLVLSLDISLEARYV